MSGRWANRKSRSPEQIGALLPLCMLMTRTRMAERSSDRSIGVVLRRHRDETFTAMTERAGLQCRLRLRLTGGFRRWQKGKNPHTRYVFDVIGEDVLPPEE
jgi:hypothetical protein